MKLAVIKQALASLSLKSMVETDYAAKGYHLEVKVEPAQVATVAAIFDQEKFFLETITGVDWLGEKAAIQKEKEKVRAAAVKAAEKAAIKAKEAGEGEVLPDLGAVEESDPFDLVDELEVVYDFNHMEELCRVVVRTRIPRDGSEYELPTISAIFLGANWHERETHDFFGIKFSAHPDLSPLLLPKDADYHPLLKDFKV